MQIKRPQKLTESLQGSFRNSQILLKDIDNLVTKQKTQTDLEDCKTIDKWTRYKNIQGSIHSNSTRRQSVCEFVSPRLEYTSSIKEQKKEEEEQDKIAQIRYDQKNKEIQRKLNFKSPKKIEIINVQKIKNEVRQQLTQKMKKKVKNEQNKENFSSRKQSIIQCNQCVQLLSMGLPTKHCLKHD
ncbi:hypothetical protein pb186bvf_016498 [Paramecium bursaria]